MARNRKDAKYLNVYIQRNIYDKFTQFCNDVGQSKTVAAERALTLYMDTFNGSAPAVQQTVAPQAVPVESAVQESVQPAVVRPRPVKTLGS